MSRPIVPNDTTAKQASTSQPTGLLLAAIYARVSTTDQADKGYSLPKQIDACLAYAQAQGYRVQDQHIFTDDFTGVSLNRPALKQLRALMRTGAIHAIICFDLDRLSRKLAHQLMLADEAEECGVTVHFAAWPASERTPESQLFTNITGAFHEYDRLRILKRTRDGLVEIMGSIPITEDTTSHALRRCVSPDRIW